MLNYLICPRANKRCKVTTFFSNGNDFQKKHSIREIMHRVKVESKGKCNITKND